MLAYHAPRTFRIRIDLLEVTKSLRGFMDYKSTSRVASAFTGMDQVL